MSSDPAVAEEAEEEVPSVPPSTAKRKLPGSPRAWLFGTGAFALAALVVAVVFGALWWSSATDDSADLARSRDAVMQAGSAAVMAYTEVDYQHLDDYFKQQKDVSTSDMAQQIDQARPNYSKALTDQKVKVTTSVQDIAVEELDDHEGKASFLAAITTDTDAGGQRGTKALRLEVSMTRVGSEWKLSGIDNVPLVAAGQ
ncbi:hypothetical protein [Amycolatopsis jiangsuensis]|uniref:Mce-associated membrane protein n=1 Tax=Amycolatopsis jiangsuensis TaxID=1181879 RepID=A0A840IXQ7_9PSEU|nr:hypothetical protein [Amycolatopsis jiangsuensis]MBB4686493.1 Mce-associated membrane protein [Amycolatopsis jiangsuensis]